MVRRDATVHSRRLPFLIVAGHPYDTAYSARLSVRLRQASVTVVPAGGHFPTSATAALLAGTASWRA